jgi:2-dehydropantoate 2-reductase
MERGVVHTGVGEMVWGVVPDPRGQVDYDSRLFPSDARPTLTTPGPLRLPLPSLSPTPEATPLDQTLAILLSLSALHPTLLPIEELYKSLLLKLAVNCAINPLTGLLGVTNGALLGPQHTQALISSILGEASAVITTYLAQLSPPTAPLPAETRALFSPAALEQRTTQILTATARNTSSMASDLARLSTPHADGTEIDAINGFLVRLGDRVGVPTPVNTALTGLVKAREEITLVSPNLLIRPARKGKR